MPQLPPEPLTETDLALLNQLIAVAFGLDDGHLSVIRFTTNWRVGFGTPAYANPRAGEEFSDVDRMPAGRTFAEAARAALADARSLYELGPDPHTSQTQRTIQAGIERGMDAAAALMAGIPRPTLTGPCIRCGLRPGDPACDRLHCEPCFLDVCEEIAQARELDEPEDALTAADPARCQRPHR
jgi:hypothetical protein